MENAKCYAPQILVGTEGLPREQWLEYRRKGIGGSDAAAFSEFHHSVPGGISTMTS